MLKTFLLWCRVLLAATFVLFTAAQSYAASIGRFQFVIGNVVVTDASGRARTVGKGDELNEGDTIGTASLASAQLRMVDGGFIAVRPDSKLKFDQYRYSGKEDGTERGLMSLLVGGFRTVTGVIGRTNRANYSINTPTATIGIRGTDHETVHIPAPGENGEAIKPVGGNWPLPSVLLGQAVSAEDLRDAVRLAQAYATQTDVDVPFLLALEGPGGAGSGSPGRASAPPGTYNLVNTGQTIMNNTLINRNQVGFAGSKLVPATILPSIPSFMKATTVPGQARQQQAKQGGQQTAGTGGGASGGGGGGAGLGAEQTAGTGGGASGGGGGAAGGGEQQSIRTVVAADSSPALSTGGAGGGTTGGTTADVSTGPATGGSTGSPGTSAPAVVQQIVLTDSTGRTLDATDLTVTPPGGGPSVPVSQGADPSFTAQQAAGAALASFNALSALVTSAGEGASTFTASSALANAQSILTALQASASTIQALSIDTATATGNAASAGSLAASALTQTNTALAAFTANGSFADSSSATAKTNLTNANNLVQSTNTTIQNALATVTGNITTLGQQQNAITTAIISAQTALNSANTVLTALTAQGLDNSTLSAALSVAQSAKDAAQLAATQAASLQAAGDFTGAQAQATIASQQATIAAGVLSSANQILAAAGATGAVATALATLSTAAAAAQSALTASGAAASTITSNLGAVTTNAAVVTANAPLTAFNNPAVLSSSFKHLVFSQRPGTAGPDEIFAGLPLLDSSFVTSSFTQSNTKYVLDGTKNLVQIRNTAYFDSTFNPGFIGDANLTFSSGTAKDLFNDANGTVYLGRIQGGQIDVTDNTATVPTFTMPQGPASTHWLIGLLSGASSTLSNTFGPVNVVQTLIGTSNYSTILAATHPTDRQGNVGTLNSASVTANFSAQTVGTSLGLSFSTTDPVNISNRNLTLAAAATSPITLNHGNSFSAFVSTSGSSGATLTCSGDCAADGYQAIIRGAFGGTASGGTPTGAVGTNVGLGYDIFSFPSETTGPVPANDVIQGVAVLSTGAAPVVGVTNTFANNANVRHEVRYPVTASSGNTFATVIRNSINLTNPTAQTFSGPTTNTNYLFDASGNLVRILDTPYAVFDHGTNVAPFAESFSVFNQPVEKTQISFGGTPAQAFFDPATGIRMGRYQGGDVNVAQLFTDSGDNFGVLDTLGSRSAHWVVFQVPTSLPATGIFHYTRINDSAGNPSFATAPTDSYGNAGVLDRARLALDFSNSKVSAGLAIHINSGAGGTLGVQNLTGNFANAPLAADGSFNVGSNPLNNPPNTDFFDVNCTGLGCAPNQNYGGRIRGNLTSSTGGANNADGGFFRYTFNTNYADAPTAAANGRVFDDYIDGLVAFKQGPAIVVPSQAATQSATTAGPSRVLTTYRFNDPANPGFAQNRTDRFQVENSANPSSVFAATPNLSTDAAGNLLAVTRDEAFEDKDRGLALSGGTPTPSTPILAANGVTLGGYTNSPTLTVSGSDGFSNNVNGCFGTTGCTTPARTVLADGLAWVRGPAPFPFYLSDVLSSVSNSGGSVISGNATYAFSNATPPRDQSGIAGSLSLISPPTLSVNFSRQSVTFAMTASTSAGTWNANANNIRLDSGEFSAFSPNSSGQTVQSDTSVPVTNTHQNLSVTLNTSSANGNVQGALLGVGLDAAGVTYSLGSNTSSVSGALAFSLSNNGNGSGANLTAPFSITTDYRLIGLVTGMNGVGTVDSSENTSINGGFVSSDRAQFVNGFPVKVDGNLPLVVTQNGCSPSPCTANTQNIPVTFAVAGATGGNVPSVGTATLLESGFDLSTGIRWGRYGNGTVGVNDRINTTSLGTIDVTNNNVHFIATGKQSGPTVLPTSGTFAYTMVGATQPTDNLGSAPGTATATLTANFGTQKVDAAVNATVGVNNFAASATGVSIQNAVFQAQKGGNGGNLTVTATGGAAATTTSGQLIGVFTGQTGNGAALLYSLNKNGNILNNASAVTVSGVAVFKR